MHRWRAGDCDGGGELELITIRDVRVMAIFLTPLFLTSTVLAESSISGVVTDSDGALLADQAVLIINSKTSEKRTVTTRNDGEFGPAKLVSGTYRVEIRAKCFKHFSKIIALADGRDINLKAKLTLSCPKDLGPVQ